MHICLSAYIFTTSFHGNCHSLVAALTNSNGDLFSVTVIDVTNSHYDKFDLAIRIETSEVKQFVLCKKNDFQYQQSKNQ